MTTHLAILGLMSLFIADYVGIVVWLMRTTGAPARETIRFSLRHLLLAVTLVSIHLGAFVAVISEISPQAN